MWVFQLLTGSIGYPMAQQPAPIFSMYSGN